MSEERTAKIWAQLLKEAFQAYSNSESPEQFQFRMEKQGFAVDFRNPSKCAGMPDRQFLDTVIDCLNKRVGTSFRAKVSSHNAALILGRRREGFSMENFMTVIEKKCATWLGTKWQEALNPGHLFDKKNFENYLHQKTNHGISTDATAPRKPGWDKALEEVT